MESRLPSSKPQVPPWAQGRGFLPGAAALVVLFIALAAPAGEPAPARPAIAVSTTVLRMAVEDIWGDRAEIRDIIPPGGCPGHYDLKPDDLAGLAASEVIVLHEFQKSMIGKLSSSSLRNKPILIVPEIGSHLKPAGYRAVLSFLAENLPGKVPALAGSVKEGLASALDAADKAEREAKDLEAGKLKGRPVVAAKYQAEFCRYWGMKVVAVVPPGDLSARDLAAIMEAAKSEGAVAVVGNEQSGKKTFEVLAGRLKLPLAMLSNFPAAEKGKKLRYRDFLLANLKVLIDAVGNK